MISILVDEIMQKAKFSGFAWIKKRRDESNLNKLMIIRIRLDWRINIPEISTDPENWLSWFGHGMNELRTVTRIEIFFPRIISAYVSAKRYRFI